MPRAVLWETMATSLLIKAEVACVWLREIQGDCQLIGRGHENNPKTRKVFILDIFDISLSLCYFCF